MCVFADRDIEVEEEILINYGYFDSKQTSNIQYKDYGQLFSKQ